jgi:hypothetical protein
MPRSYDVNVTITNPKAMFTYLISGASANSFIQINAGVTTSAGYATGVSLNDGALVKNIGANSFLVKTNDVDHGANTGYMLIVPKTQPKRTPIFNEVPSYDKILATHSLINVSGFTGISSGMGISGVTLEHGVTILNYNKFAILIKTNDIEHGANSGFYLNPGESFFVECQNLNKIQVKPYSGTETISLEIIGG